MEAMNAIQKIIAGAPAHRSPGAVFKLLVDHFPVVPVTTAAHHRLAKATLAVLMDLKRSPGLRSTQRRQVTSFIRVWCMLIAAYEADHFQVAKVRGVDALRFLMEQHGLGQGDLRGEVGPQPVVSRILRGERELTAAHIGRLAKRFGVSAAVFFDDDAA